MDLFVKFLFILCVSCASAQVSSKGKCTDLPAYAGFEVEKIVGKWYEIQRYENIFQLNEDCVVTEYILNKNGSITETNTMTDITTKKPSSSDSLSVLTYPDTTKLPAEYNGKIPAIFNLTHDEGYEEAQGTIYQIIDIDYTDYCVIYWCEDTKPMNKLEMVWIMSRNEKLSSAANDKIDVIIKKYFDADYLRPTIQTKDLCQ